MAKLFDFFNETDIIKKTKLTVENIDNLGIKMLDFNQIIDQNLINQYKTLDSYRTYLIKSLASIDSILNNKNKCQNTINNLLNNILISKNSEQLGGIRNLLIDNIFKSFNYKQIGGVLTDDLNKVKDTTIAQFNEISSKLNIMQKKSEDQLIKLNEITNSLTVRDDKGKTIVDDMGIPITMKKKMDKLEETIKILTASTTEMENKFKDELIGLQSAADKLISQIDKADTEIKKIKDSI
jgi:hypothetical protein